MNVGPKYARDMPAVDGLELEQLPNTLRSFEKMGTDVRFGVRVHPVAGLVGREG